MGCLDYLNQKLRLNLQDFSVRPEAGRSQIGLPHCWRSQLFFLVLPDKPVYGYLGAQDGQEEGEDAVLEVVAVGRVDDEGG